MYGTEVEHPCAMCTSSGTQLEVRTEFEVERLTRIKHLLLRSNLVICNNLLLNMIWHIVIFLKCHGVLSTALGHAAQC